MIKYKYFKYIFFRYCIYNILYFSMFMFIPILFYTVLVMRISFRIKNQSIINLSEIITPGFNNLKDYTVLFKYINNIDNILIIIFFALFFICYFFVKKHIINQLLFKQYNKIIISMKQQSISLLDIILLAFIECLFTFPSSICIYFWNKLIYINYFYILQASNYLISCILTYFFLNKFLEHYIRIRFKLLKV